MRTKVLNQEKNEINWDKKQWLMSGEGKVVFTNGEHGKDIFEGTSLPHENDNGHYSRCWSKSCFKAIPKEGLTIHISND
jgi:hypothetical protein